MFGRFKLRITLLGLLSLVVAVSLHYYIKAENMECINFVKKIDADKQSIIFLKNEL